MRVGARTALAIAVAMLPAVAAEARRPPARPAKAAPPKQLEPLGNYRNWFSTRDYPQDAAVQRQQGTTGFQLDILARAALWRDGLDYNHGTGHGVVRFYLPSKQSRPNLKTYRALS